MTSRPALLRDSVISLRMSLSSSMTRTRRLSRRSIPPMLSLNATTRQQQAQKRALDSAQKIRQRDIQALCEVSESRERRRDAAGFHLPHVLALEIHDALGTRAELCHGQALLLAKVADPLPHFSEETRLARDVRIHPRRHTNSTTSPSASSPYDAPN